MATKRGSDWTVKEVQVTVATYLQMLQLEAQGRPYSKAEFRRKLLPQIEGRTKGAVEYKFQNISAVLLELGMPCVDGYKPAFNYQGLLLDVVQAALIRDSSPIQAIQEVEERAVPAIDAANFDSSLEDPPRPELDVIAERVRRPRVGRFVDYIALEARNYSLGRRGEEWVVGYEKWRLECAKRPDLALRVEHTSKLRGDGLGYDVLSFDSTGEERYVEVKTTKYSKYVPFYLTKTEVEASHDLGQRYQIYRVFGYRERPSLYMLPGPAARSCLLEPIQYLARPA